ncbi:hypothetical protein PFISCL1PPCAC_13402, partial [Pristionchus fissidentatus]
SVDWASRGESRPLFGAFCIVAGGASIIAYARCLPIIWSLRALSVYKIMCVLAVADISDLVMNSIIFGVMTIRGDVYCMHPVAQVYCSILAEFFFFCSTVTCVLLALNRFGELLHVPRINWLFEDARAWWTLSFAVPVGLFISLFTPPLLFHSKFHMFLLDPMI